MMKLMIQTETQLRTATAAEVAEVHGRFVAQKVNRAQPVLQTPTDSAKFLINMIGGRDYESFVVLFLDNRHRLIEAVELFRGTIDGSSVHPREVVKEVLWKGAAAVIFAHNHPSGVLEPSSADEMITLRLRDALALIEVRVLDHLIVGAAGYTSMASRGLI